MNWYRLLMTSQENRDSFFCAFTGEIPCLPEVKKRVATVIPEWHSSSWVGSDSPEDDGEPDDYLITNQEFVLLSARVREVMEADAELARDVQFLPIHVRRSTGEEIPGYSVLHVLPRIEALKREACFMLYEKEDPDPATGKPRIFAVGRLVVYALALDGHHVVRLLDYPSDLLCSERFAKLWKKHKFTGAWPRPIGTVDEEVPADFKSITFNPATIV